MTCSKFAEALSHWLAGAWDTRGASPPQELLAHARDCSLCRARLAATQALLAPAAVFPAPAGVEGRIMDRIRADATVPAQTAPVRALPGRRRHWATAAARTRYALAGRLVAAAAVLVLVTALTTIAVMRPPVQDHVEVHLFLEAPGAEHVAVAGDWNGWRTDAQPLLDVDGDGVWEIRLSVPRGREYQYQFVVDGQQWVHDPRASFQIDDGYGGMNSVLDI